MLELGRNWRETEKTSEDELNICFRKERFLSASVREMMGKKRKEKKRKEKKRKERKKERMKEREKTNEKIRIGSHLKSCYSFPEPLIGSDPKDCFKFHKKRIIENSTISNVCFFDLTAKTNLIT